MTSSSAEVSAELRNPRVQAAGRVIPAISQAAVHSVQVTGAETDQQPRAAIEQSLEITDAETRGRDIGLSAA